MYVGVALGYGMLDVLLLYVASTASGSQSEEQWFYASFSNRCVLLVRRVYILRTDWQLYADKAVARSEMTQKAKKKLGA